MFGNTPRYALGYLGIGILGERVPGYPLGAVICLCSLLTDEVLELDYRLSVVRVQAVLDVLLQPARSRRRCRAASVRACSIRACSSGSSVP